MFGGVFDPSDLPRFHFDYFGPAMLTGFILMTGAWYDATAAAMEAAGPRAAFYFVFVMVVNCYLNHQPPSTIAI